MAIDKGYIIGGKEAVTWWLNERGGKVTYPLAECVLANTVFGGQFVKCACGVSVWHRVFCYAQIYAIA